MFLCLLPVFFFRECRSAIMRMRLVNQRSDREIPEFFPFCVVLLVDVRLNLIPRTQLELCRHRSLMGPSRFYFYECRTTHTGWEVIRDVGHPVEWQWGMNGMERYEMLIRFSFFL